MQRGPQSIPSLLQLPDACLLAILQCCADNQRSLFNAARAHSRLHQAAVLAASSIMVVLKEADTVHNILKQQRQQTNSVLRYLRKHGQHVSSINIPADLCLGSVIFSLQWLPQHMCKLQSLTASNLRLQLQPGRGYQGVLRAGMPLQQLCLGHCELLDGDDGLAAALSLLPELQHLSIKGCGSGSMQKGVVYSDVVYSLQQLTYLELTYDLQDVQGLRQLTALQDLRLKLSNDCTIDGSVLAGAQHLTCLQLHGCDADVVIHPGVLAGKTQLQHLAVGYIIDGGSAGVTELLSHLQHMQQLTYLSLNCTLEATVPAAADYSALTASSNLRLLDIRDCTVPVGAWQHIFPSGRQLPHLQVLKIGEVHTPEGPAAAPEGSRLVSCCPGLQTLSMQQLQYSSELLAPLTGLSSLQELSLEPKNSLGEGLEVVWQLTGLRRLELELPVEAGDQLLQLTQLQQLTHLEYTGCMDGQYFFEECSMEEPGDEPVWHQLLELYLDHSDPEMVAHARAALAGQCF